MSDYLTQLARRVQQPELVVQPRLPSLFESPRYLPARSEVTSPREGEPQASPTSQQGTILEEWTNQARAKNRDEAEAAELMPEAGWDVSFLEGRIHQPYLRESVDSLVDRKGFDQRSSGMGKDIARDKPFVEPYEEVVRRGGKAVTAPGHNGRSSRDPSFALSLEPRESSAHAEHVVEWEHRPHHISRDLKLSAPRNVTVKQEPDIGVARKEEEPRMAMRPCSRTMAGHDEKVSDATLLSTSSESRKLNATTVDILPVAKRESPTPLGMPTVPLSLDAERITPPPNIHVSIGRIEVRATNATVPPKKRQVKSSAMSLDEYLTRRNEARR